MLIKLVEIWNKVSLRVKKASGTYAVVSRLPFGGSTTRLDIINNHKHPDSAHIIRANNTLLVNDWAFFLWKQFCRYFFLLYQALFCVRDNMPRKSFNKSRSVPNANGSWGSRYRKGRIWSFPVMGQEVGKSCICRGTPWLPTSNVSSFSLPRSTRRNENPNIRDAPFGSRDVKVLIMTQDMSQLPLWFRTAFHRQERADWGAIQGMARCILLSIWLET